jgi:hypothetical protein
VLVGFLGQEHRIRAEPLAIEAVGPLGVILDGIEERRAVRRPADRARLADEVRRKLAAAHVLDVQRVLAESGDVRGIGQPASVIRKDVGAQAQEWMSGRQLVQVEHDLLGGRRYTSAPAEDRILQTLLRPGIEEVFALRVGHGYIGLLDPRQHLAIERLAKRGERGETVVGVGVLRLEIGADLGILTFTQPTVVVDQCLAVPCLGSRPAGGARR